MVGPVQAQERVRAETRVGPSECVPGVGSGLWAALSDHTQVDTGDAPGGGAPGLGNVTFMSIRAVAGAVSVMSALKAGRKRQEMVRWAARPAGLRKGSFPSALHAAGAAGQQW